MSKLTLTPEVTQRLREILQDSGLLTTDQQLQLLFTDSRLTPWKNSLTQANSVANCIEVVIALQRRFSVDGNNALILCLQVLQEHIHPGDALHHELGRIIQEIAPAPPPKDRSSLVITSNSVSSSTKNVLYSDRQRERHIFHKMLQRDYPWRGLLLHSNGQKGLGKSTLLQIYERQCRKADLPYSTVCIHLDAQRLVNWLTILDRSVEKLGVASFNRYLRLRATYETRVRDGEGNNFKQTVTPTLSDLNSGGETQITVVESKTSLPELRKQLTHLFLADLALLKLQLVWLVDTAERLDFETEQWLHYILDQLADDRIDNLILVVARLYPWSCEPSWERRVGQLPVTHFSQDVLEEILQEVFPTINTKVYKFMANLLMYVSNGQPVDVVTYLESYLSYGGSYDA